MRFNNTMNVQSGGEIGQFKYNARKISWFGLKRLLHEGLGVL